MAPMCPEEVDVFSIPHSRMKELVNKYLDRLTATNFDNEVHLTSLLETLCITFREFIAHEQIENKFIMKKLKNRMKALSIQNSAVCNCHKDNQLIDMLNLFEDGYKCTKKSDADRANYGLKLRQALEEFTGTFLPHMAEEEQVFQPLLMQHFSVEELKQIKATVLQQHFRIEPEIPQEKFVEDNVSSKVCSQNDVEVPTTSVNDLSDEMVVKIFSFLNPKDLCRTAQVSTRFNKLAMDRSLWTHLYPVSWANGDWDATEGVYLEDSESAAEDKLEMKVVDEDADVDESDSIEDWDTEALAIQRESMMLTSMCKYLLPCVGASIQHCDLAYSKGLTNGTLFKILSLCHGLEYLNLTQTRISDLGFKGFGKNGSGQKLKHLDLTGCLHITDLTLERLSSAYGQVTHHMTEPDHMTKVDAVTVEESVEEIFAEEDLIDEEEPVTDHYEKDIENQIDDNIVDSLPDNGLCGQERENCCKEKDNTGINCTENENRKERFMHGNGTCCQNTAGCMKVKVIGRKGKSCKIDSSRVENESTANVEKNVGDETGESGNLLLRRLLKCVSCGKVDEVINRDEKEETAYPSCCQERPSNHGNQSNSCHGRASTATDRDRCCKGKCRWKKINSVDESHEYGSVTCNCSCRSVVSCCQGTKTMDGQGQTDDHSDDNHQKQVIDKSKTQAIVDEHGLRMRNDFPVVCDVPDQGLMPKTNISNLGTKETYDLEHSVVLDNNIPRSGTKDFWEGSLTLNDSDPVQTEIPMLFIMGDLDLRFGMINSEETSKNNGDACSPEQNVTLTKRGINDAGPPLEFLSLSGCYQITDTGLSCLSENGGLPNLKYLDLSGCLNVTGPGVAVLVDTCLQLDPSFLFYCDNILDGPYPESASGCQNLQCPSRICCRSGE